MSRLYPVYLDLKDKKCLVVGGGRVAERKVQSLLAAGASVFVVSPTLCPLLNQLLLRDEIIYIQREYSSTDLDKSYLVISATNNHEVNTRVAQDCFERNIMINVVDSPDLCNFFVPAVVQRGDLSISISTGGKSPMLAKRIREDLEKAYGNEYVELLKIMGELRKDIIAKEPDEKVRRHIFEKIIYSDILNLLAEGNYPVVKGRIKDVLSSCGVES